MLKKSFFPSLIAILFILIIICYRVWIGVGFGFQANHNNLEGMISSGFVFNLSDNMSYVSWIEQAVNGHLLFVDLYTTEPHERLYFNPYFLLLGNIGYLFNIPSAAVMILFGIFWAAVVIYCSYYCSLYVGFPELAAKYTTLLVAFSSGFSGLIALINNLIGSTIPFGADVYYQDGFTFSTFIAYPYHAAGVAFMVLLIYTILNAETNFNLKKEKLNLCLIIVLTNLLGFTHPYELVVIVITYNIYVLILLILRNQNIKRSLIIALIILCSSIPSVSYSLWISHQHVWSYFANASLNLPRPRLWWIIGYGPIAPLALYGVYLSFKNSAYRRALWFSSWLMLLFIFLIIFPIKQTKICNGGYIPFCILAGIGLSTIIQRIKLQNNRIRNSLLASLLIINVLFGFLSVGGLLVYYKPLKFDADLKHIAQDLKEISKEKEYFPLRILCDTEIGNVLPGISGQAVFAGHWALTPQFTHKKEKLIEAGFESQDSGEIDQHIEIINQIILYNQIDYILVKKNSPIFNLLTLFHQVIVYKNYRHYSLLKRTNRL